MSLPRALKGYMGRKGIKTFNSCHKKHGLISFTSLFCPVCDLRSSLCLAQEKLEQKTIELGGTVHELRKVDRQLRVLKDVVEEHNPELLI